jgi:hypothetical protein
MAKRLDLLSICGGIIMGFLDYFITSDIFGLYDEPSAYRIGDATIMLPYPIKNSDKMVKLGWFKHEGRRWSLYEYPGNYEEFKQDANSMLKSIGRLKEVKK